MLAFLYRVSDFLILSQNGYAQLLNAQLVKVDARLAKRFREKLFECLQAAVNWVFGGQGHSWDLRFLVVRGVGHFVSSFAMSSSGCC